MMPSFCSNRTSPGARQKFLALRQHQRGARAQRHHDHEHRDVKAEREKLEETILLSCSKQLMLRAGQIDDAAMLDHDALRLAGGARGIDHVSEVPRSQARSFAFQAGFRLVFPLLGFASQVDDR